MASSEPMISRAERGARALEKMVLLLERRMEADDPQVRRAEMAGIAAACTQASAQIAAAAAKEAVEEAEAARRDRKRRKRDTPSASSQPAEHTEYERSWSRWRSWDTPRSGQKQTLFMCSNCGHISHHDSW